jgi:hypothetical protein
MLWSWLSKYVFSLSGDVGRAFGLLHFTPKLRLRKLTGGNGIHKNHELHSARIRKCCNHFYGTVIEFTGYEWRENRQPKNTFTPTTQDFQLHIRHCILFRGVKLQPCVCYIIDLRLGCLCSDLYVRMCFPARLHSRKTVYPFLGRCFTSQKLNRAAIDFKRHSGVVDTWAGLPTNGDHMAATKLLRRRGYSC